MNLPLFQLTFIPYSSKHYNRPPNGAFTLVGFTKVAYLPVLLKDNCHTVKYLALLLNFNNTNLRPLMEAYPKKPGIIAALAQQPCYKLINNATALLCILIKAIQRLIIQK